MSDPEIDVSLTNYARGWNDAVKEAAECIQKAAGVLHQLNMLPNEAARLDSHAAATKISALWEWFTGKTSDDETKQILLKLIDEAKMKTQAQKSKGLGERPGT